MFRSRRRQRAFTLAEMIVSAAILSILAAAMMSAVMVASHAMPESDGSAAVGAEAIETVDQIAAELMYATTISEVGTNAITFTVADRGHGAAGPETIRYAWSGTAGDPLTREYNGGAPVTVCPSVQSFSLSYGKAIGTLTHTPRVILVVANPSKLGTDDSLRLSLLQSWGFDVNLQDDEADPADFNAAAANADVIYISERVMSFRFKDKASNMSLGVVLEEGFLLSDYGIADYSKTKTTSQILVTDNTHEITAGLTQDWLTICTSDQILYYTGGDLAAGVRLLATFSSDVALGVVELDGQLLGNERANARRVKLPWGGDNYFDHFEMASLNDDAQTMLRRAIVWAAAPVVYSDARVTLETTADPAGRAETDVTLLNQPEVSKP